jgi:hypothetical protein
MIERTTRVWLSQYARLARTIMLAVATMPQKRPDREGPISPGDYYRLDFIKIGLAAEAATGCNGWRFVPLKIMHKSYPLAVQPCHFVLS